MHTNLDNIIEHIWKKTAPFFPLERFIAVNPLQGFEDQPIESALQEAAQDFQRTSLPEPMREINRQTIKWLQAFFDKGQATIPMPNRHLGLYLSWLQLARFDPQLHQNHTVHQQYLQNLSQSPTEVVEATLALLGIEPNQREAFLSLMLSTLPGWATHIKYRRAWAPEEGYPIRPAGYLAMRLATTYLLWPQAKALLQWHQESDPIKRNIPLADIQTAENTYIHALLAKLRHSHAPVPKPSQVQCVFCIDIRSEPIRRILESMYSYETFGFAGFFGLPITVKDAITGESYPSCPVIIEPKHLITNVPDCKDAVLAYAQKEHKEILGLKGLYQSVKYTFGAPFILAEALGLVTGIWMTLKTLTPILAMYFKKIAHHLFQEVNTVETSVNDISFEDQLHYAEHALRMIGLVSNFAPIIILCGHGSESQNNPYARALDCGACGGHHGDSNARALAAILNSKKVRTHLQTKGINIPQGTQFIAAKHNTATNAIKLYAKKTNNPIERKAIKTLETHFKQTQKAIATTHAKQMGFHGSPRKSLWHNHRRSVDWAQVRPEWGLAKNAAFLIGPRYLSTHIDLESRVFLQSYDYQADPTGKFLRAFLTAPFLIGQWSNMQYFFSTLDNVAYGAGSKITKNITGKIGLMQGNASDLMHGLPFQSLYSSDTQAYHVPLRLTAIVYAPKDRILDIIQSEETLHKIFKNGWARMVCIDPQDQSTYQLQRNLQWESC